MAACQKGHNDIVRQLVHSGAEIEIRNYRGKTSLYLAAMNGHVEVVQFLIERHADVNACDKYGGCCLLSAVFYKHTKVVHALVAAAANVNLKRNDGLSPLMVACQKGYNDIAKQLVLSGAEIEIRNYRGATPLYFAARNRHINIVQFLIEHNADVNACDSYRQSCLLAAVYDGDTEVVRALVSAGADVNLQRIDGVSPLMIACENGHIAILRTLLEKNADLDATDNIGHTALWFAAQMGHTAVVKALANHGADVDASDCAGRLSVSASAVEEHINTVKSFINDTEHDSQDALTDTSEVTQDDKVVAMLQVLMNIVDAGIDHAKTCYDTSALMDAVFRGRLDVVKVLVECGADIQSRNVGNLHAVDVASYCGHVDIVGFLLRSCQPYVTSHFQFSPKNFSAACLSPCAHIDHNCNTAMHLVTDIQHMKSLLMAGVDVEAENVYGQRPIHCVVNTGSVELIELLIQCGANVNAGDKLGNVPLHEAACRGLDCVELLVQRGAELNIQNIDGKSPLHTAVEHEQTDVIIFLLKNDADIAVTDVWHNTPLHYLTAEQLSNDKLQEYINTQSEKWHSLPVCNVLAVMAPLNMNTEEKTANPKYTDCYGNTPLHRAVGVYGHLKMYRVSTDVAKTVQCLVKRGADINGQNKDGLTPLHVARGKQAMKACLQHVNDKSFATIDKRGRNFWHLLFISRSPKEVDLATIRQHMTSPSVSNVDDLNRTPLHYACMKINAWIGDTYRLAKVFITYFNQERIDEQDRFGRTALHYAAMSNNSQMMQLLIRKCAHDTLKDNFEKTASQYRDMSFSYNANPSRLKYRYVASVYARKFREISVCVQSCFSGTSHMSDNCKAELLNIIRGLTSNATCLVSDMYSECRFDYSDIIYDDLMSEVDEVVHDNVNARLFGAIKSQVEQAMKYLAEKLSVKDARFGCEQVVPVGSASEGTKIGCCDEFDYNVVLTDLSKKCKVCYTPESPPGFVLLKASTPTYDEELFNKSGILNTRTVKFRFEMLVKEILSSFSFCTETGFEFIDTDQDFSVSPGTVSTKLHTKVKLAFTKPVNGYYVPHDVSVDIVPTLHIDGWWPDDMRGEEPRQPYGCLIVFTQPQIKYPWIGWTEPHGFITFAPTESRLLRERRKVVRNAYMVVKQMSKYFCQYDFFSSHVIKTALLWCLDEDRHRHDCTSSDDSDEVSGDELLRWVQNILRRLLCFAAQDYVPSYFLPKCHQPVWLSEKYLKESHVRLYRHGLTKYEDLFSLSELQSRDRELQRIKEMFILSHVMYWSVLSDTDELKLFVPSTINPLTENDVCTTLLPVN